jgi:hypothetical protein
MSFFMVSSRAGRRVAERGRIDVNRSQGDSLPNLALTQQLGDRRHSSPVTSAARD